MDPVPFQDIAVHDHDLLMIFDYSLLEYWSVAEMSGSYEHLHLVAWSMGVWAASYICTGQEKYFATTTAVNGTLCPIDDQRGIPHRAVTEMINNFSISVLYTFYESMFSNQEEYERFFHSKPKRTAQDILHELVHLERYCTRMKPVDNIFNRIIVGSRDRIFPARNQVRSWSRNNCSIIRAPHFPFYGWSSWDHLLTERKAP